uniref:Uncharacterized protein n=1 Tax=Arundo donax TaxID=35708 RepID=A0A0A9DSI3_ARUDO
MNLKQWKTLDWTVTSSCAPVLCAALTFTSSQLFLNRLVP